MAAKTRLRVLLGTLSLTIALAVGQTLADSPDAGADERVPEGERLPVAENVDLSEPIPEAELSAPEAPAPAPPASLEAATFELPGPGVEGPGAAGVALAAVPPREPLVLLGEEVAPGTSARLSWSPDQSFEGIAVPTAVLVVNGLEEGPTLCLTAALHGDELNGIEIVRRVLYDLEAADLKGTVIGVPIVNLQGFRRGSRYLPDRRDLNRFFPGTDYGSSASRIAYSFFHEVIHHCDALVDVHTGSFKRTNLPQLRADMKVSEVADLTEKFGATSVLHSPGAVGTLRRAAVEAGIPAVTLETGEPGRLQEKKIAHGTKGIQTLLNRLGMYTMVSVWGEPEPVYYQSKWVRADRGGLLFARVSLGQRMREGEILGTVTDPITNLRSELRAPEDGRVLGMALNQVVLPGFAAYRIGIPTTESELASPEAPDELAAEPEPSEDLGPPEEENS